MSKITKIKELLKSALMAFAAVTTDKGLIQYDGDVLEVGTAVRGLDEEGQEFPLEDGDYKADDGTIYRIADNKLTEIVEPEMTAPAEDETAMSEQEPASEDEPISEPDDEPINEPDDEPVDEPVDEPEPAAEPEIASEPVEMSKDKEIEELQAKIIALEAVIEGLNAKLAEPAAEPAQEEFEKVVKPAKGDEKFNRLMAIASAK